MTLTREELWSTVRDVVAEVLSPSGVAAEDITPDSLVSDLGLTSVDAIHTLIILEERLGKNLDFEELVMRDGEYVTDLSLHDLHGYLCRQLGVVG